MRNDLTLAARLELDSRQWVQGLTQAKSQTRGFVGVVKSEFQDLRGFIGSTGGMLASMGVGYGVAAKIISSAKIDQQLTLIKQTAGMTADQTSRLREELQRMAGETGNTFASLQSGFGLLVAGGLEFEKALPTIDAVNKGMRVTAASGDSLIAALLGAQEHFDFDLSKPGQALALIDKMAAAGRAGVIEIEDLAGVFADSAAEAKAAGLTFEETLALYEGFGTATTKGRLGTLVKSTLRVFTNDDYMLAAQKASGVQFFDEKGMRRGPLAVIADIKKQYDKLATDRQRFDFISAALGQADLDTITGFRAALEGGKLQEILNIATGVSQAGGTVMAGMTESMDNAVAQANVLRERLSAAGDALARPINDAFTAVAKYATGKKEDGGLDLSGGQLAAGSIAAIGAAYIGSRLPGWMGKVAGGTASLGTGLVMGEALEQAGAATPVFVVGAAPGVFSAGGSGITSVGGAVSKPGGGTTARSIGTGGILARLGLVVAGWAGPLSMLADPRNYSRDYSKSLDDLPKRRGFDWLRDLWDPTSDKPEIVVTVEVNDQRTRITGVKVLGEVRANSGLRESNMRLGKIMSPGAW